MHIGFWWERDKEREHCENLDVDEKMTFKRILETCDGVVWAGLI
jgi:hypothetical protein